MPTAASGGCCRPLPAAAIPTALFFARLGSSASIQQGQGTRAQIRYLHPQGTSICRQLKRPCTWHLCCPHPYPLPLRSRGTLHTPLVSATAEEAAEEAGRPGWEAGRPGDSLVGGVVRVCVALFTARCCHLGVASVQAGGKQILGEQGPLPKKLFCPFWFPQKPRFALAAVSSGLKNKTKQNPF